MTLSEVWGELATRGLIAEDQPLPVDSEPAGNPSPWYVQVMMGACAWFAGLMLMAFVVFGLMGVLFNGRDNWWSILVVGILTCGGAGMLYASVRENSAFGTQFALAMSFAGQIGIAVGLGGMGGLRAALWGMIIAELGLAIVIGNRLHRVLTTAVAIIAWALATHEIIFRELPGASISQGNAYQLSLDSIVLWLVIWGPVAYGAFWLVKNEARWIADGRDKLLRPITYGVIASLAIAPLATHPTTFWIGLGLGSTRDLTVSYGGTALWPLLAMMLAVFALALGFALRNRPLMGVAMVFALLEIGSFYYVLGTTLLVKSIIMILLGAALMASAQWLAKESR